MSAVAEPTAASPAATSPQTSQQMPVGPSINPHLDAARAMLDKRSQQPVQTQQQPTQTTTQPQAKVDPLLAVAKGAKQQAQQPTQQPVQDDPLKSFETPPEGLSEKGKVGWKEFHAKSAEILKQQREFEAQARKNAEERDALKRQYEETVGKYKDYDTIAQERAKLSERLKVLDFENHPEFVQKYVQPGKDAAAQMQRALDAAGQKVDAAALLALQPTERRKAANEIIGKMTLLEQKEFSDALFAYEGTERARGDAYKQAEQLRNEWKTKELANQYQTRQMDEALLNSVYQQEVGELYQRAVVDEKAGDAEKAWAEKYNAGLDALNKNAREFAFNAPKSPEEAARTAVRYAHAQFRSEVVLPALVAKLEELQGQYDEAKGKLTEIEKARPGYNPAGAENSTGSNDFTSMGHEQAARAMLGRRR